MPKPIGRIAALHRYPVKSMAGEEVASIHVTRGGVLGDRSYALIDQSTGLVVSAKRPRKWAGILDYAASFVEPPRVDLPIPPVQITLPNGTTCSSTESEDLDERLSHALENGRHLSITGQTSMGSNIRGVHTGMRSPSMKCHRARFLTVQLS